MLAAIRRVFYHVGYLIQHIDTKNIKIFGVCVVIAACLWLFNALRKEHSERISYPITFNYSRDKYISVGDLPTEIPITIRGSGWQILRKALRLSIHSIEVDIEPEKLARRPYFAPTDLTREIEKALENVRLEGLPTDTIKLDFDQRYKRVLRLKIDSTKLNLNKDFRVVTPVTIKPELVAVVGPKKLLKALPNPYLLDISEAKITSKEFKGTFDINIKEVPSHLLLQDEEKVTISFGVERFVQKNISVPIETPQEGEKPHILHLLVNYIVRESRVDKISPQDFAFELDWHNYKKKDGFVTVHLKKYPKELLREDIFYIRRLKVE